MLRRYKVTGRTTDRPRSGRPCVTTDNDIAISAYYTCVTHSSLWRHPQRMPIDTPSIVTLYVADYDTMTLGHIDHSEGWHWLGTLATSEMTRIYQRTEARIANCVQNTLPFGGGSVMAWGGICGQQRINLIVIDGNLTSTRFYAVLLPFHHQHRISFQQDYTRLYAYIAHVVQQFLAANNANVLPWSALSPDLPLDLEIGFNVHIQS